MTDEEVYVVPRSVVMPGGGWHGLRTEGVTELVDAIGRAGRFEPRGPMERDESFKQVIPYLVLRDGERYFLMHRTKGGRDERLHDRWSIGVGGHLNPGDGGIDGGLKREWDEEVAADFTPEFRLVALLNDDTTDVGRVHLGVVYVADAAGRRVAVRETEKLEGEFAPPARVREVADDLETWSRLAFEYLDAPVR
ncbi:MAG: NUDIX hydrolase [Chloroflexota bacterium]